MTTQCTFAFPGTYGHECGAPAVVVGVKQSELTKSGVYFARRCAKCQCHKGGENRGLTRWEAFDATKHVNAFV